MFITTLFVIAKNWAHSQGNVKLWYIHTMKYYWAIKREELLIHTITWTDSKEVMLNGKKEANPKRFLTFFLNSSRFYLKSNK